jgi:hypothetical protein
MDILIERPPLLVVLIGLVIIAGYLIVEWVFAALQAEDRRRMQSLRAENLRLSVRLSDARQALEDQDELLRIVAAEAWKMGLTESQRRYPREHMPHSQLRRLFYSLSLTYRQSASESTTS